MPVWTISIPLLGIVVVLWLRLLLLGPRTALNVIVGILVTIVILATAYALVQTPAPGARPTPALTAIIWVVLLSGVVVRAAVRLRRELRSARPPRPTLPGDSAIRADDQPIEIMHVRHHARPARLTPFHDRHTPIYLRA